MATLRSRCGHYILQLWLLSFFFFFLAYSQRLEIGCLPYFHTWCGNTGCKNDVKNRHLRTIGDCTTLLSYIFSTKACIDNWKKGVKQQYLLHMSLQYGELWSTNGWDRLASLGHPSKFQRVSRLGFITAAMSLTGGQPNFARCLAISWAGTLCVHFRGFLPLTEFCQVQNSLCVQVLPSPILAALLHSTPAAGVSKTLRCRTRNRITELSQRAPPIFSWAAITLGIIPHSSFHACVTCIQLAVIWIWLVLH